MLSFSKTVRSCVAALFLVGGLLTASSPTAQAQTIAATTSGWYDATGLHQANNNNYVVGLYAGSLIGHHDYLVFNLTSVTATITSAQLSLYNPATGYTSPQASDIYTMFDVSTSAATLIGNNNTGATGATGIYSDLGSGTSYGNITVTSAVNNTNVVVSLNSAGLVALNAARGGFFSIGGDLTTSIGNTSTPQSLFAFSQNVGTQQLILSSAASEPGTTAMILFGVLLPFSASKLRRRTSK